MYRYNPRTEKYEDIPAAKPISIRVPQWIIDELKKEASHNWSDKSYQSLINKILEAWCDEKPGPEKYCPKPKKKKNKTAR